MDPLPTPDGKAVSRPDGDPPRTPGGWLRANGFQLAAAAAAAAAVCRYLHPLDLALAVGGLGLIVFLHELGHFLAAKWCDVHVTTFSIGFGPALPFCHVRYGETTYKLALIPLGGYVAMVGQGDDDGDLVEGEADPEAAAADPRSFKNKPVGQRMLVISAGVVMNLVLACGCFVAAYLHGVDELPAVASHVEPGSAAWRAGLPAGAAITELNGRRDPWFDDVRPVVSSTSAGETVRLEVAYAGATRTLAVEPLRPDGVLFPQLGIRPPEKPTLRRVRREVVPPYPPGSPAAAATGTDGDGFRPGDAIVAATDPDAPGQAVTPLDAGYPGPAAGHGAYFDLHRRLMRHATHPATAGRPVVFRVARHADDGAAGPADPVTVTAPPAFRKDVGLRMRMGEVAAVRAGSPAAAAGVRAAGPDGKADRLVEVAVRYPDGRAVRFAAGGRPDPTPPDPDVRPLDPLRLPFELEKWADAWAARTGPDGRPRPWADADRRVRLTVLRDVDHTDKRVELTSGWDHSYRYDLCRPTTPSGPVPVSGLGLAYHVLAVVDAVAPGSPADRAGLRPDDKVTAVRVPAADADGRRDPGTWAPLQPDQWAFADYHLQSQPPHALDLRVDRAGRPPLEVALEADPDPTWPTADLGLAFAPDTRLQKADGVAHALELGAYRTLRSVRNIYLGLYAMTFGRVSATLVSGPITLARASYLIAGEDVWHLLLWVGLISVNLAVVNFLPIPVLDGGHMVFLGYEWLRGKPAPNWAMAAGTYLGLGLVLSMMAYVVGLDLWRLVKTMFG